MGRLRAPGAGPMLPAMDTHAFDVLVVGAGIAGASLAAHLAAGRRVALIEAEPAAGYHSTGRSAALWVLNYGPPDVRALTGLSRGFFEAPPPGFAEAPLLRRRPVVFLAPPEQREALHRLLAEGSGLREAGLDEVRALIPALRPGYAVAAAVEDDAFDVDVAALHAGFLRRVRAGSGVLVLGARVERIERVGGVWRVRAGEAEVTAPVLVDAAGAWGDEVARRAGVAPLGLLPKRRTAALIAPHPYDVADWPLVNDVAHTWYARPEARAKLMVSPADETETHPHDVRPEELDVALAVARMQQALGIEVRRVEHAWAGLRTFTPDGGLALGWDGAAEGFFWCVGQGGYGIQTSPAAGRLAADLIAGRDPGAAGAVLPRVDPRRFRA